MHAFPGNRRIRNECYACWNRHCKKCLQVHYVAPETGEIVNKQIKRSQFLEYFANRAPCMIGMEACGSAYHWARQLMQMGHQVKLMPAKFVKAFNVGNKKRCDGRASDLAGSPAATEGGGGKKAKCSRRC